MIDPKAIKSIKSIYIVNMSENSKDQSIFEVISHERIVSISKY